MSKLTELIDMGLIAVRKSGLLGLMSAHQARKMAVGSFLGGVIVGGGVATYLLMRGDNLSELRARFDELKGEMMARFGDRTTKPGMKQTSKQAA